MNGEVYGVLDRAMMSKAKGRRVSKRTQKYAEHIAAEVENRGAPESLPVLTETPVVLRRLPLAPPGRQQKWRDV